MARAYQNVPEKIEHQVRIIQHGADDTEVLNPGRHWFGDLGTLAFLGDGVPRVAAGPFTITARAAYTKGGGQYQDVAGAGWAVDEHAGKWALMTSGLRAGRAWRIIGNTATRLYLQKDTVLPANGDTFNIVTPACVVNIGEGFTMAIDGRGTHVPAAFLGRVLFGNIDLAMDPASTNFAPIAFHGSGDPWGPQINGYFSRIVIPVGVSRGVDLVGIGLNGDAAADSGAFALCNTGLVNVQLGYATNYMGMIITGSVEAYGAFIFATALAVTGHVTSYSVYFAGMNCQFTAFTQYAGDARLSVVVIRSWGALAGASIIVGHLAADKMLFIEGDYAIALSEGGSLTLKLGQAAVTADITNTALLLDAGSRVKVIGANTEILGATGAATFSSPDPDQVEAVWPAVGEALTDSLGSFVVRYS
jgi:hypothetical protein